MVSKSIVEIQQGSLFLRLWGKQTIITEVCGGAYHSSHCDWKIDIKQEKKVSKDQTHP